MDEQNVKERQEICTERHLLVKERMEHMKKEETACGKFAEYFRTVSSFLTDVEAAYEPVSYTHLDVYKRQQETLL